ncbi:hypothetical protein [Streptomyces sp. NPDC051310]|uniref:hypothetical protein n=1 Tax=Streptomyces sp. NPDC051310 TaxID=3365649 RepID=UPI0037A15F43
MSILTSRRARPVAIAVATLGVAAGALTAGAGAVFDKDGQPADTVVGVAAQQRAKQQGPDEKCSTAWRSYKPRKTFMWDRTSSWVLAPDNDALKVRFRSMGGEFVWRYDSRCKRQKAWIAHAGLHQTAAQVPQAGLRISPWYTTKERCGTQARVNRINACFRGKDYNWVTTAPRG